MRAIEGVHVIKKGGNEVGNDCNLPIGQELTEIKEIDDETLFHIEEDWNELKQTEDDKGVELNFTSTMETRQSNRGRDTKKYNLYNDDFVVDKIALSSVGDSIG